MDGANAASAASLGRASSLIKRFGSAVLLIPLFVGLVYWGVWPTVLLVATAVALCLIEFYGMLKQVGFQPRPLVGLTIGLAFCLIAPFEKKSVFNLTHLIIGGSVLLALITELPLRQRNGSLTGWAFTFAGAYYIGGLLYYYILLRQIEIPLRSGWLAPLAISPGAAWVFVTLAITWLQDTAAFFVGRKWGRHKLAPYLSPKKSWEGAISGFIVSIATALLAVPLLGLPISYTAAVFIGITSGIAGPLGDLSESLLKRQIGIKDSGNLIPGHGGILDRADSLLFNAPIIYYLVILLTVQF